MFFGDVNDFPVSYTQSYRPRVFLCAHKGRDKEYGVETVLRIAPLLPEVLFVIYGVGGLGLVNVLLREEVSEQQFNEEIGQYQACLRFNKFDGFADCVAKSLLLGQYPITKIPFPLIDSFSGDSDLIQKLRMLPYKHNPNPHSEWWRKQLCNRIEV